MTRRRSGFTMVEALVAAGLFTVVLATLFFVFFAGTDTVRRGIEILDISATSGLALEHLKRDLRALAGEPPAANFVSAGEMTLELSRVEALDARSGSARMVPVRWHLVTAADRTRTLLEREAGGARTRFLFEREATLLTAVDPDVAGERGLAVQLAFPAGPGRPARPPIQTTVVTEGGAAAPRGDRPFAAGPARRTTDPAQLFPEWARPRPRR